MSILYVQQALKGAGFDPGPLDGAWGAKTKAALDAAISKSVDAKPVIGNPISPIPADWLPPASMQRIIVHWTAGPNYATALDKAHYHLMIEGDGAVKRGNHPITANAAPLRADYAAHTARCNTGSIGVSLCGMAGAVERPFSAGASPITAAQWAALAGVLAQLCRTYRISVRPETVLTHAEVQPTLGIAQAGKWDIAALPFDPDFPRDARKVGDRMRSEVTAALAV